MGVLTLAGRAVELEGCGERGAGLEGKEGGVRRFRNKVGWPTRGVHGATGPGRPQTVIVY